jgi:hypothetical protein
VVVVRGVGVMLGREGVGECLIGRRKREREIEEK